MTTTPQAPGQRDTTPPIMALLAAASSRDLTSDEIAAVNANLPGLDDTLGFVYDHIGPTLVRAHFNVDDRHRQPFGLVNGGVFASAVESCGSLMSMNATGAVVVGTSNSTEFLRAVTGGSVDISAEPIHVGATTQLIDVTITQRGRVVARGRLRTLVSPHAATPRQ